MATTLAEAAPCATKHDQPVVVDGEEELGLPLVPIEVVVEFVLPHAFDSFAQALELMLLCSHAYEYATTRCAFWETFLWRRFHQVVIPRLEVAYHRYGPTLINLLRTYARSLSLSLVVVDDDVHY
jgi:hypothetical protein